MLQRFNISILLPKIGMRKIKSLLAVLFSFLFWQVIRIFISSLDLHPGFAYIYSIIEMRDSSDKTIIFGFRRIKATFLGLVLGLSFIFLSNYFRTIMTNTLLQVTSDILLISVGIILALCLAELLGCKNFCGVASTIFVICFVWHTDHNRYFYAIMRVIQTLLGVFSAWLLNAKIFPYPKHKDEDSTGEMQTYQNVR
jgi:uncharacterized membrane protein YgaE (UPF0421/DUF939 family)